MLIFFCSFLCPRYEHLPDVWLAKIFLYILMFMFLLLHMALKFCVISLVNSRDKYLVIFFQMPSVFIPIC